MLKLYLKSKFDLICDDDSFAENEIIYFSISLNSSMVNIVRHDADVNEFSSVTFC